MVKNLTISKLKALNCHVWHGVDETRQFRMENGEVANYTHPIVDMSRPYGDWSAHLEDRMEGVKKDFLIMEGYAVFTSEN